MKLSKYYNPELCKNLIKLREQNKYSEKYVAEYLGTTQEYYNRYEKGTVELPLKRLIMLCQLYDVSADELLGINIK